MLVLKKNDPNVAILPDSTRATLFIDNSARDILSIKQANGYIQLLTFHDSNLSGNLSMNGNILVSNGQVIVGGNITGANLMGPLANGTSNIRMATSGGNAVITIAGNSTMTVSATGANIVGTANISANTAIGGNLTVAGNIQGNTNANITGNTGIGGNLLVSGSGNVVGEMLIGGNANIATNLRVAGDTLIVGNIIVQGNTTYINVENLNIEDPILSLGGGPNGAPLTTNDGKDRGTALQYFTTAPVTAFMGWDNGNSEFAFGSNVTFTNEVATYNQLGNIRAGNFIGSLSNGTSSVAIPAVASNVNIISAGNTTLVVTPSGANITGTANITGSTAVGGKLDVTGNITAANIRATLANGSSNIAMIANGNITVTSGGIQTLLITPTGANINGTANINGVVTMGANLTVTGNVTAGNLIGPHANGTSNVNIPAVNGNVNISSAGNANILVVTGTGANITGTANITGNTAIGSNLTVTANVTAANLVGPHASGNSNISLVANGNISMTVAGTANVMVVTATGANIAGTANVTGNTIVGNLSTPGQVIVTGNITGSNLIVTNGVVTTETTTGNIFVGANTTTVNIGLSASTMTMGAVGVQANLRGILNVANYVVGNTAYYSNGTGGSFSIGYRDVPQITANANITLGLTDAGKHFYANSVPAFNVTVPTHANVSFPIGTAITIVQSGANSVTVVPQSGVTLRFAGSPSSTGNRTISSSGMASLLKLENNVWMITGAGVA